MDKKPDKKPYEAPAVKKVKLEIKNAILSICHGSPGFDADTMLGCHVPTCMT